MTPDFEKLREEIANTMWPLTEWDGLYTNALEAADAILAIPAIADVLRMKPIQTMPIRERPSLP